MAQDERRLITPRQWLETAGRCALGGSAARPGFLLESGTVDALAKTPVVGAQAGDTYTPPPNPYGYTFWTSDDVAGVPSDTFMSRGHNQNHSYVMPSLDLVVGRQGNDNRRQIDGVAFSGTQVSFRRKPESSRESWTPAFAGVTNAVAQAPTVGRLDESGRTRRGPNV